MDTQIIKLSKFILALFFLTAMSSCKQNQSITQARHKDIDKIPAQGQQSVYVKNLNNEKLAEINDALETIENKIDQEDEKETILSGGKQRESIKNNLAKAKDLLRENVMNQNTASTKTSLKDKVQRSKLAFKHLNELNKVKKALKQEKKGGTVSLLLLVILILLILILLALLGLDLITLLILTLLVLLIYLLLIS